MPVTGGLKAGGWILINSAAQPANLEIFSGFRLAWVDATAISIQNQLGTRTHPIINAVCGRVCFHPCENACNRDNLDAPLAIHNLERFLGDTALLKERIPGAPTNPALDQKVAVAGAGPAGLSAAYFLTRLGYRCEVFEAGSAPGGMLRLGIPGYRLPRNIVDHEIKRIENQGVKIHCGIPVVFGGDLTSPGKSVADAIASGKQAAMALNTYFEKDLDYCKGCGVCATECPRNAMALEEEIK